MKQKYEIALLASSFRKKFSIDDYSPINLFSIVQMMNDITYIEMPLSGKICGMFSKINNNSSVIVINSNMSDGKKNYSIGHELYHYYLSTDKKNIGLVDSDDPTEKEAELFASYLLISYNALIKIWNDLEELDLSIKLLKIEHYYHINRKSLLNRLKIENLITQRNYEKYSINVIDDAIKYGFPIDLYEKKEDDYKTFGRYVYLTDYLYKNKKISEGKKKDFLIDAFIIPDDGDFNGLQID